jgi:hypothetical protein
LFTDLCRVIRELSGGLGLLGLRSLIELSLLCSLVVLIVLLLGVIVLLRILLLLDPNQIVKLRSLQVGRTELPLRCSPFSYSVPDTVAINFAAEAKRSQCQIHRCTTDHIIDSSTAIADSSFDLAVKLGLDTTEDIVGCSFADSFL